MDQDKQWRFCVAGNIVKSHLDEEGVLRYGTKAFTGGTKVYLDGKGWKELPSTISVIGQNRFGRYVLEWVPMELIENVRCQRVFKRTVLNIMDYLERMENWSWWQRTAADRREAEAFAERFKQ